MKKTIVLLVLHASIITAGAQELTKKEIRVDTKAQKEQMRRQQDSLRAVEEEQARMAYEAGQAKKGANTILCVTTFKTKDEAFVYLVNKLYDDGYIVTEKDRDFHTLATDRRDAGMASYSLHFRIIEIDGFIIADISGRIYTSVTTWSGLLSSQHNFAEPIENRGMEGSALQIGFGEMERYAATLPHEAIKYVIR